MAEEPKPSRGLAELEAIEAVFDALAHETRRHILQVLDAHHGEMRAGDLSRRFAHSWPTTTRHLQRLLAAELVQVNQVGRERLYRFNREHLADVLALWLNGIQLTLTDDRE